VSRSSLGISWRLPTTHTQIRTASTFLRHSTAQVQHSRSFPRLPYLILHLSSVSLLSPTHFFSTSPSPSQSTKLPNSPRQGHETNGRAFRPPNDPRCLIPSRHRQAELPTIPSFNLRSSRLPPRPSASPPPLPSPCQHPASDNPDGPVRSSVVVKPLPLRPGVISELDLRPPTTPLVPRSSTQCPGHPRTCSPGPLQAGHPHSIPSAPKSRAANSLIGNAPGGFSCWVTSRSSSSNRRIAPHLVYGIHQRWTALHGRTGT
jgi:hypothetical protein